MIKVWLLFLITVSCFIFGYYSKADNIGLDYSIGNSMSSYGFDLTKNYGLGYLNPQFMFNKQSFSPSISFGFQIEDVNLGLVGASDIKNSHINGLGGVELGFTNNLTNKFYIKENNQFLRDTDSKANFSITLSSGINF